MRVALVQLTAGPSADDNLQQAIDAVREAAARGARLVVLPEKWLAMGAPAVLQAAARDYGAALPSQLGALAAELQIDLVAGSIPEPAAPGDPRPYNAALHLRPDGTIGARYRKVHLFDADVDGRRYRESEGERAGDELVTTTLAGGTVVGLSICFDLRFGGLYDALARRGAQILVVPAAFTLATTHAHWEVLLRARAIEHGCFVLAANQCGAHADGSRSGGQSMVISPWGEVLARASEAAPEVLCVELDLAEITRARAALPTAQLRRDELYRS